MKEWRATVADTVELQLFDWAGSDERAPFLLVHGLASNARLWDGVGAALSRESHRAVAVDQRGHGLSDKPDDGYDFETLVDDLVAVIDAAGLDRPVVAGQSWGAHVVLELAARRPELIRGAVLVDGGTGDFGAAFPTWEECEKALAPPRSEGTPFTLIEQFTRRRHPDWPETGIAGSLACFEVREDGTVAPRLTFERHMKILRELWGHRASAVYPDVKVPLLLLPCDRAHAAFAERKRAGVEAAAALAEQSRTVWFDADHDVHAQKPEEVARLLLDCVDDGFFS